MERMIAGYRRFQKEIFPEQQHHFRLLADSQRPHTLFITCSDSRVVPTLFTQTEPGELFLCRVVGNLVPAHGAEMGGVASAVEYAVTVLGVRHVVVCGHSDCGAMRAFLHPEKLRPLKAVEAWLEHAQAAIAIAGQQHAGLSGEDFVKALIDENVVVQLQHLKTHPSVAAGLRNGSLEVHGWVYDIGTGLIRRYDEDRNCFEALDHGFDREASAAGV